MNKSIIVLVLVLSVSLTDAKVQNVCNEVFLNVALVDPTENQQPIKKGPVVIPSVSIEDHTLFFTTPCGGCTLKLVNDDGDAEYATVIPMNTTALALPSYLLGEYQLQIVRGNYCFWGILVL